jgi:beta-phosphoglucomutase-like phosphatase (HAD superfamily)
LTKYLWFFERKIFPETIGVIRADITLEKTLINIEIKKYFKGFKSSTEIGMSKPDPKIFNAALNKH